MPDLANRVRHLADAAAALGHKDLSRELHEVARLQEARHTNPDPDRLTEAMLVLLTELVREVARLRNRL